MRRSVFSAVVLAAGLTVLGGGCVSMTPEGVVRIEPVVVTPERPLPDVPVPTGFTYKSKDSYIFNNNYRYAKLHYRGVPHIDKCVAYFKEQMPQSRWSFVRDSNNDGRVVSFQNEAEEMSITFDRRGGITFMAIEIKPRSTT